MPEQPQAYSVSAITRMIKDRLESSFRDVWVQGEISNYLHHSSGHRYFNLKDERTVMRSTMWRAVGAKLKFEPKDGQKVLAYGDITVYEKGGSYQLNCRKLVPVGVGELELAFRQLHEKLSLEGLFEPDRKKPLPRYPHRIGIVTSPTGAAIRDIIQIATRRNDAVQLLIYPAQVQGDGAEATIVQGIEYFNTRNDVDLIIIGRGGGSLEDLWCFNTEQLVRAVVASRLPIISAVGHEVDTTLSDLAADMRAPTPSAAAELAVWSRAEFLESVRFHQKRQAGLLEAVLNRADQQLRALLARPVLARPLDMTYQRQQALDQLTQQMIRAGKTGFERWRHRLSLVAAKLEALSPLRILARGYTVSRRLPRGQVLRSAGEIIPGDRMETLLTDGRIVSFVEEVKGKQKHARKEKA
ncbi:MAG: exodeoxyribonuclease VII large subunit [bacterium]